MNTEYKSMRNAAREDMTLFPSNYSGELPTVIEAYKRFADAGYCPMSIRNQAKLVVSGSLQKERSQQMKPGEYYSKGSRSNYDGSLMSFLELTLIRPTISTRDTTLKVFTLYPLQILRRVKERVLEASDF
jgi:hypothetical protein